MNDDVKETRTKAVKSQCLRGVYTSFKSFLTLIAESPTAQILIIYAPVLKTNVMELVHKNSFYQVTWFKCLIMSVTCLIGAAVHCQLISVTGKLKAIQS